MVLEAVKEDADKPDINSKTLREYEALSNTLSAADTKDLNLVRDMDAEAASGLWDAETKAFIDAQTLKALFFSEDWVFITVDLVASKLSRQWLRVMRRVSQDGKEVTEPAENHPFTKVIERPNAFQDYHSFMYVTAVDTVLEGNGIVWSGSAKDRMMLIPAETISISFDGQGAVNRYDVVELSSLAGDIQRNRVSSFSVDQIAHIRRPNPSSYLWGLSPFIPARKSILFNRYSSEYLNNFYLKGATPGLALEMSDVANEQTALRMLRSFEMAYTGRRNQRRTLVLPKGVSAKEVSHTLADQQLKDYIAINRETILGILKVPKHEVSLQTAGSLGSEEYKTALKNFWASTLKPLQSLIAGTLTKHFQDVLGEGYFLEFDNSDVDVLQEDETAKADLASKLLATHTLNEVRAELYQLPPVPGGDVVMGQLQPGGVNPFGLSVQNALAKAAELRQLGAPGVAATDSPRQQGSEDGLDLKAREAAAERAMSTDWFKRRQTMADRAAESGEEELSASIVDIWADMAPGILKAVKRSLTKGLRLKAELPSRAELRKRLRDAMGDFEERWIDDTLKVLESKVDIGYDISLVVPFKLPAQDELLALRERNASKRRAILEERGLFSFAKVNETTTDRILGLVEQGVAEGKTIQVIASNIADTFSDIANIESRARTIARTETLTAVSIGQAAAMEDAAQVIPNLKKMWMNAGDDRVRGKATGLYPDSESDHWKLQGQVQDHDKPFVDPRSGEKLMYPRAPGSSAGAVINCRCTWVALPAEDMESFDAG